MAWSARRHRRRDRARPRHLETESPGGPGGAAERTRSVAGQDELNAPPCPGRGPGRVISLAARRDGALAPRPSVVGLSRPTPQRGRARDRGEVSPPADLKRRRQEPSRSRPAPSRAALRRGQARCFQPYRWRSSSPAAHRGRQRVSGLASALNGPPGPKSPSAEQTKSTSGALGLGLLACVRQPAALRMRRVVAVIRARGTVVAVEHQPQDLGRIEGGERLLEEFPPGPVGPNHDDEPFH
jgi:hypothetical protein